MSKARPEGEERDRSLLALCARPWLPPALRDEIGARAARVTDWPGLLDLAEKHGLGPLLYHHLRSSLVDLPPPVSRQLQALYVRHRRANEVRLTVLREVLEALEDADILPTVLKGPLLIDRVYADPGLRPMADLDLLVPPEQVIRAQHLLEDMGFIPPAPISEFVLRRRHHLSPAVRVVDGVVVQVEVHLDALGPRLGLSLQVHGRAKDAVAFNVGGIRAYSLPPDEMLWHLCRHSVGLRHGFRLIWAADVVGFAETFLSAIDWVRIERRYPFVLSALSLYHCLSPIPERVLRTAGVNVARTPKKIGEDYRGWGAARARTWDSLTGRVRFLARTLNPPEWWLRLNYGTGTIPTGAWQARARHGHALIRYGIRLVGDAQAMRRERRAERTS